MNTINAYAALTPEEIDGMKAAARRAGAWPVFHDKSGTWQVEGHRIDLWFSRRHFPDPKPIVRRCWQSTPQWRDRMAAYDETYGSGPVQLALLSVVSREIRA